MKQKRKILILVFSIFLLTLIAIAREYIFVWINAAINNNIATSNNSEIPQALLKFNKQHLYYLKWILSVLFGVLNIFISILATYLYFNSRKYAIFISLLYGIIGVLLSIGYALSKILNFKDLLYNLLHDLLLLLQTPILFIIIFPILIFYKKQEH